ncbi:hypothetical protein FIBSPDRAFT_543563 [Athelia psychrophila]|uniref:Uncharacterized protein n=1 Tax=Athelia psychrophila TaxID=1759441 RepID=A0A166ITE4_9AGAM|nr:hypothetical protein FIBSPDRAFT_543563 [Fibularhizoctonia sp. CBS 109695]
MGLTAKPGGSPNLTSARLRHSQTSKLLASQDQRAPSRTESTPPQTSEEDKLELVPGGYGDLVARLAEIHKTTLYAPYVLKAGPEAFATFCQTGGSDPLLDEIRYHWDEPSQTITVLPLPSPGHASVSHFIDNIFPELVAFISKHTSGESKLVKAGISAHELVFPDGKAGEKGFDIGLELDNPPAAYPPIVFEVGASESYLDLKRDAWDWLWGSCHQVQVVILVKLHKPAKGSEGELEISNWGPAYVEVWERAEVERKPVGDIEVTELPSSSAYSFSRPHYEQVIRRRGERLSISLNDPPQSDHLTLYIQDFLVLDDNSPSIKHGSDGAKLQLRSSHRKIYCNC